jgi:hypothetical protein
LTCSGERCYLVTMPTATETRTALTTADLRAMGEITWTRIRMIELGLEFFAEESGGGVYYTGTLTDEQWAEVDAVAAAEARARG